MRVALAGSTDPARTVVASPRLERFECNNCGRLLFRHTGSPLRTYEMIEIKCWHDECRKMNFLVGPPD